MDQLVSILGSRVHNQEQTKIDPLLKEQLLNKPEANRTLRKSMTIETDLKEIRNLLSTLNKKVDVLLEDKETLQFMVLAEKSLKEFLEKEPDIYTVKDVKAKVKHS